MGVWRKRPRQERGRDDEHVGDLCLAQKTAVGKAMPHNKRTSPAVSFLPLFPRRSVPRTTHQRRKMTTDFVICARAIIVACQILFRPG
jgi:hypothetical protein